MSTTSSTVLFATVQDLPEALLVGHERVFIAWFLPGEAASVRETFDRADIDEYERVHRAPGVLRGMLGSYRAVLADLDVHAELTTRRVEVAVLALGGEVGSAPDLQGRLRPLVADPRGGVSPTAAITSPRSNPKRWPPSCAASSPTSTWSPGDHPQQAP